VAQERNKLIIIRGKGRGKVTVFDLQDAAACFQVLYNPTEYSMEDRNRFSDLPIRGLNTPLLQYSRGSVRSLAFEILLDTHASGPLADRGADVRRTYIDWLEDLMRIDGDLHRPPLCKVIWASLEFTGFLESIKRRFTLFLPDGTPVRARVGLCFREAVPVEAQAMQTKASSPDRVKRYTVTEGDTIWEIANREYGDPDMWRPITEANGIDNPRSLTAGREIVIPALERRHGR
jgi:hypothetical protein